MSFVIADWHWLVLGMLLMLAEIVLPSFTIFWFGLGALVVAGVLWLSPALSLSVQLLTWAAASIGFTALWFKLIRPYMQDRTKAGIALEAVRGVTGQVIRAPADGQRGIVRFSTPLLGDDEWPFICDDPVVVGDRVRVKDVSGNTLIVARAGTARV
jgi:membrane protein implicated in regulation of membrane protease activity